MAILLVAHTANGRRRRSRFVPWNIRSSSARIGDGGGEIAVWPPHGSSARVVCPLLQPYSPPMRSPCTRSSDDSGAGERTVSTVATRECRCQGRRRRRRYDERQPRTRCRHRNVLNDATLPSTSNNGFYKTYLKYSNARPCFITGKRLLHLLK